MMTLSPSLEGHQITPMHTTYREALASFPTGVTVVTTQVGDRTHGMTANAFLSLSMEPPLVGVAIAKTARMHGYLQQASTYGISILADDQEAVARHFAGQTRLPTISFLTHLGVPVLPWSVARLACSVAEVIPVGDHTLYVGQVVAYEVTAGLSPLVYYHRSFRHEMCIHQEGQPA